MLAHFWLAMVLNGQAAESLLATYNVERQPGGERVVNRAWTWWVMAGSPY